MNLINEIENNQLKTDLPELNSGDSVKVNVKVSEGNRERIQTLGLCCWPMVLSEGTLTENSIVLLLKMIKL